MEHIDTGRSSIDIMCIIMLVDVAAVLPQPVRLLSLSLSLVGLLTQEQQQTQTSTTTETGRPLL
jgi:hypothetical protein